MPGGAAFSAGRLRGPAADLHADARHVLLVAAARGRTRLAGGVSATFPVARAAAAPVLGRLVDRLGQARVLFVALAVHTVGPARWSGWRSRTRRPGRSSRPPSWPAAATPSPARWSAARWSHVLAGRRCCRPRFSWESVVDEVIFVVGPVLVTVLATGIAPAAGLLAAYGFTLVGSLALAVQRRTQPPTHPVADGRRRRSVLPLPGRAGAGAAWPSGSARSSARSRWPPWPSPPSAASRPPPASVLALLAGGSLVAGLWYGTVRLAGAGAPPLRARRAAAGRRHGAVAVRAERGALAVLVVRGRLRHLARR